MFQETSGMGKEYSVPSTCLPLSSSQFPSGLPRLPAPPPEHPGYQPLPCVSTATAQVRPLFSLLLRVVFSLWLGFWPLCPAPILPPSPPPLYRWAKLQQLYSRSPFYYIHLMTSLPYSVPISGFPLPKRSVLSQLLCLVSRILPSERWLNLWTLEKECLDSKLLTSWQTLNK